MMKKVKMLYGKNNNKIISVTGGVTGKWQSYLTFEYFLIFLILETSIYTPYFIRDTDYKIN
jgi:hypothetical protein